MIRLTGLEESRLCDGVEGKCLNAVSEGANRITQRGPSGRTGLGGSVWTRGNLFSRTLRCISTGSSLKGLPRRHPRD